MSRFIDLSHVFEDRYGADLARPAPGWRLERDIFIVENLCNLAALPAGAPFRLFAVPIRARGAGSMPIRAFAELS